MNQRVLNTAYSVLHWKEHAMNSNDGWINPIVDDMKAGKWCWQAILWCPVCFVLIWWRYLKWVQKR